MYESGLTFPQIVVMCMPSLGRARSRCRRWRKRCGCRWQPRVNWWIGSWKANMSPGEEHPEDWRVRMIRMRARGRHFMDRLNEIRRQELSKAFDRLPPGVRGRLTDALREAVEALASQESPRDTD